LFFYRPKILLIYKDTYFNTNDLYQCLYNVCVSLLQDCKDIFPDEIPNRLPHIKGIKCQIALVLGALYLIVKPIKVILIR
jgi:hypothetical protein